MLYLFYINMQPQGNLNKIFPFSAVNGQTLIKRALLFTLIDPQLGGILISGPRGVAKSTLVRGLADLLPNKNSTFINLPLGASEEQLIGSINLEQALSNKKIIFQPGLLYRAHKGILYIDEVNLLPDNMVDILLDVASSGLNIIERDGISHTHPAEFILIGTMNPDEGEIRPQLRDRFGLCVYFNECLSIKERINIVRSRIAFEKNPQKLISSVEKNQKNLSNRIRNAIIKLHQIILKYKFEYQIAEQCIKSGVEGLRADIAWQHAAIANSALEGRLIVNQLDIDYVKNLILNHRYIEQVNNYENKIKLPHTFTNIIKSNKNGEKLKIKNIQEEFYKQVESFNKKIVFINLKKCIQYSKKKFKKKNYFNAYFSKNGYNYLKKINLNINWYLTLINPQNLENLINIKYKNYKKNKYNLDCIIIDISASIFYTLNKTKKIVSYLIEHAYLMKRKLAILIFSGLKIKWLFRFGRASRICINKINKITASGTTPLQQALEKALYFIKKEYSKKNNLNIQTWIFTDARTNYLIKYMQWPTPITIIDTDQNLIKIRRAKKLAISLNGYYQKISNFFKTVIND
ncbi:Magnesium-chelatase subunit ChlI [Candidatus Johnevansia muelleri]|uniref:Magnesium-chelatase subunit ChlI n=1 Tax=Candidatus Johnevansia muelleri TaxID=1495769 RepID=A0A078KIF9_9GAMM|nr:Magnesium-chelatase subunit ChlI [Candidatus Evansia muelleri]